MKGSSRRWTLRSYFPLKHGMCCIFHDSYQLLAQPNILPINIDRKLSTAWDPFAYFMSVTLKKLWIIVEMSPGKHWLLAHGGWDIKANILQTIQYTYPKDKHLILVKMLQKSVFKGLIDNELPQIQVMVWRQPITYTNVGHDVWPHMSPQDHSELKTHKIL